MQKNPVTACAVRERQRYLLKNWDVLYSRKEWLQFLQNHRGGQPGRHILYVSVGADDVLDLIGVRILKREAAGSDQHPLPVFGAKAIHHRQDLAFQFHHLQSHLERLITGDCYLLCKWIVNSSNWYVLNLNYRKLRTQQRNS